MRAVILVFMTYFMASNAMAKTILLKEEVVEEQEKSESKTFCSKNSASEAANLCEKWLDRQIKSLGQRLLTSSCTPGDQTAEASCLYRATGEVKYALKKYRTNTERE